MDGFCTIQVRKGERGTGACDLFSSCQPLPLLVHVQHHNLAFRSHREQIRYGLEWLDSFAIYQMGEGSDQYRLQLPFNLFLLLLLSLTMLQSGQSPKTREIV